MERRKVLLLQGRELLSFGRPTRSQLLYRLRNPVSLLYFNNIFPCGIFALGFPTNFCTHLSCPLCDLHILSISFPILWLNSTYQRQWTMKLLMCRACIPLTPVEWLNLCTFINSFIKTLLLGSYEYRFWHVQLPRQRLWTPRVAGCRIPGTELLCRQTCKDLI